MNPDTFRVADESDASAITKLVNAAYRPSQGAAGWTHEAELVAGERTTPAQVVETIRRPNSVILVRCRKSAAVACVHVEKEGNDSHIGMLAVDPALQATGIGKQMLALAEDYAVETFGAEKFILIVVSARSELVAFYLRRGYQRTGFPMDYPISAGTGIPRNSALKIEVLEKRSNIAVDRDAAQAALTPRPSP